MITTNVNTLKERGRELWAEDCKWEGIPADSSFVVFSPDNPHKPKLDEATRLLLFVRACENGFVQPVQLP